jgi:hypothetical protein
MDRIWVSGRLIPCFELLTQAVSSAKMSFSREGAYFETGEKVASRLHANKMAVNLNKTELILFHTKGRHFD